MSAFWERRRQSCRNSGLAAGAGAWPCSCSGSLGQQPRPQLQVFLSSMPPPPASVYVKAKLEGVLAQGRRGCPDTAHSV